MNSLIRCALLLWALGVSGEAMACKVDSDCRRASTRCINAHWPGGGMCGRWDIKDTPGPRMSVIGKGSSKPGRKRNDAATGAVCSTDRDCAATYTCSRPSHASEWRCVPR